MNFLGLHVRHDAGIAVQVGGDYRVIELERIYSERYFSLRNTNVHPSAVAAWVSRLFPNVMFDAGALITSNVRRDVRRWKLLPVKRWLAAAHHLAHAAVAFYQSPFDTALVISYDGGGNDGWFRPFIGTRQNGIRYLGPGIALNLGSAYAALAVPIREIRKNRRSLLANSGKLMGLAGYGTPRTEWTGAIRSFYTDTTEISRKRIKLLPDLGTALGLDFSRPDTISGPTAYDFAATCQAVFEDLFLEQALPLVEAHGLPVCLSGGCALNVIANEKLARRISMPLFVPPNPNDCGLPLGAILQHFPPGVRPAVTYSGVSLLDLQSLGQAIERYEGKRIDVRDLARLLASGNIIGVARGNSEHGPRALGNRSLLCDPGIAGMKDRLNLQVKFRESFRPYAPVTRQTSAERYFDCLSYDMSYMSFNPAVKESWRSRLPAIVHVDGTSRVQTVTAEQNPWLFELLTEFEQLKGYDVLLNTSFNTKGKPILSTVDEALHNARTTDLDYVLIDDFLFDARTVRLRDGSSVPAMS